jgi:phytoene desaturase
LRDTRTGCASAAGTRGASFDGTMHEHIVIVGGGLAGLAAGCYARANGFRTTILEHNIALGGVCTAWRRDPYVVDGCIQWLTGGPFEALYHELGIVPRIGLHPLEHFASYRNVAEGIEVAVTRDLDRLTRELIAMAPEDEAEIRRLMNAALDIAELDPGIDASPELLASMQRAWETRTQLAALLHFRKPMGRWASEHLKSDVLRRFFLTLVGPEAPTLALLFVLGYLHRGYLSRPRGGTRAFLDALIRSYDDLGGDSRIHTTVDEILVDQDRVTGVRLSDGTELDADLVISTSSMPETVLRLLGGRYEGAATRKRLDDWKLFEPIVLVSFGVAAELTGVAAILHIDGIAPFDVGGRTNDALHLRIFNDEPTFAPVGHTVVQATLTTTYDWWAKLGSGYGAAKDVLVEEMRLRLAAHLPRFAGSVRMTDVATPLTFWNKARSWRGAYEGWFPTDRNPFFTRLDKKLRGVEGLYLAGQWVEPGGGVPLAIMSGRQVVQLICEDRGRPFQPPRVHAHDRDRSPIPSHRSEVRHGE